MATAPVTGNVNDLGELARLRLSAKANAPEALRTAARQFEAMFTQMLLKSARAANPGDSLFGSDQTEFYQDMYDQQLAQSLSSGKGLGIADLLIRQLQQGGGQASTAQAAAVNLAATPSAVTTQASADSTAAAPAPPLMAAQNPQDFVARILPHAEKAAAELGVPARTLVAQAALETGWGQRVTRNADGSSSYNLFGIKADSRWRGDSASTMTHEYENGERRDQAASFRSYDSIAQSFSDYVAFIRGNPRYAEALRAAGDGSAYAQALQRAGYATDPAYAKKIQGIVNSPTLRAALQTAAAGTPSNSENLA